MEKLNLKQFKHVIFNELRVSAKLGSNLDDGLKECMILSILHWKTVIYEHNDDKYTIEPFTLFKSINKVNNTDSDFTDEIKLED